VFRLTKGLQCRDPIDFDSTANPGGRRSRKHRAGYRGFVGWLTSIRIPTLMESGFLAAGGVAETLAAEADSAGLEIAAGSLLRLFSVVTVRSTLPGARCVAAEASGEFPTLLCG